MDYRDLTNEQRLEFKQHILTERNNERGDGTLYGELADADRLVSDEDAESYADGIVFSPDDFSCGVAADRDGGLSELKEWAERELLLAKYAKLVGSTMRLPLAVELCIDWARNALLDHIKAVKEES